MENLNLEDLLNIIKLAPKGWEKYSVGGFNTFPSYANKDSIYVVGGVVSQKWVKSRVSEEDYHTKEDIIKDIKSRLESFTEFLG